MRRKPNPALIGGFVLGALALAVAGLVVFGGGRFFRTTQAWVAYFDESTKGLTIGAPVTFRGIRIGKVTNIRVILDPKTAEKIRTPVYFEIEADRLRDVEGKRTQILPNETGAEALIEAGLRARLEMQSFLTGQLAIDFDFYPNTPVKLSGVASDAPEFPTIPSAMSSLGRGLQDLNMAEVARDLQETMRGIARIVNGPEVKQALTSGSEALQKVERLAENADRQVAALAPLLAKVSEDFHGTLGTVRGLVRHLDADTVPAVTETVRDVQRLVRRVDEETVPAATEAVRDAKRVLARLDAETVPAANQALADVRPILDETVKTVAGIRGALEQVQKALASLDGTLDAASPTQYQLRSTLRDVSAAARAVRALADSLERHPESLLQGKGGK
jgi:paraquat-inducible protein B